MKNNDASIPRIALALNITTILVEYVIFLDTSFTAVHDMNALTVRTTADISPTTAKDLFILATELS